jgi:hypothetical protein
MAKADLERREVYLTPECAVVEKRQPNKVTGSG